MAQAGYSGTPLLKKLGVKAGQKALLFQVPENVTDLHEYAEFSSCKRPKTWRGVSGSDYDYVHLFTKDGADLQKQMPRLHELIVPNGMIWVSWPKKASKVPSTADEGLVRSLALKNGLVDVKVCAVDEVWSGLKLVIRLRDRK